MIVELLIAMTALVLVAAIVAATVIGIRETDAVGVTDTPAASRCWLEEVTRQEILVHTRDDGQTIFGQLVRVDVDGLVLEPAKLLDADQDLGGHVWIPREKIAWTQHPTI